VLEILVGFLECFLFPGAPARVHGADLGLSFFSIMVAAADVFVLARAAEANQA